MDEFNTCECLKAFIIKCNVQPFDTFMSINGNKTLPLGVTHCFADDHRCTAAPSLILQAEFNDDTVSSLF